ncbi:MAG: hypothetical protein JWN79_2276 [Gemmatimonadetes bacterium]|jgi:membrane-associated phospholipid phosphatase|nr:hypothetical protein [Gemmatimonadota bacterium]
MRAAALPLPHDGPVLHPERQVSRALRFAGSVVSAYLAATLVPMLAYARGAGDWLPLVLHLLALGVALGVTVPGATARWARDWMPLAMGPFLYIELRWLIVGVGRAHADASVIAWEHAVFAGDPSSTWATRAPWLPLSEWLHLSYASYYLLVLVPPVALYLRGRREAYARTVLALALVYALCFVTYLLFPVDGPRYLVGPAMAPEGPVRSFVLRLLAAGSSRGTAFPSSHVAASVVASLCALQHQRGLGVMVALLTAGLVAGTVYGGFHYGVDALAGLVTGLLAWALSIAVWCRLAVAGPYVAPGAQSATAA